MSRFPILGVVIPWIAKRRIPLNRDGTVVDTGQFSSDDERGYYFVNVWEFEWLGLGIPLYPARVRLTSTGEFVDPNAV